MIRTRNKATSAFSPINEAAAAKTGEEWEVRPGGMLVQKRSPDSESAVAAAAAPVPTIRVKVKYESVYYEIYLSSQATFGELRKLVGERTGVHPQEQKIVYKDKEREPGAYLDACGVRDKSKMVMAVDPTAHAKRVLDMRRAARLEKAARSVSDAIADVDRLALKVSGVEARISKGEKVADEDVLDLIERLMTQLIKLEGVVADGDIKLQRGMQVRRVQKYVETLDALKIKNARVTTSILSQQQQQPSSVVVTTEWEMFDSLFGPSTSTSTSTTTSTSSSATAPRSDWQLF